MSNVAKVKSTFYFSFYIMLFSFVQFYCPLIFLDLVCTNYTAPTQRRAAYSRERSSSLSLPKKH